MPKILLADDSTHAQRMGVKILSAEGFEVVTVSNGKAAIDSFQKSTPDLVIADVFMPGRNGYEVCQHVKTTEELKHIPVLLIIGAMEPYDPDEGKKAGADGVITKPLESSALVTTVKGLIDAAKRFAPTKPKKEKVSEETVTTTSTATNPYGPVVEDPSWAVAEEIITTTAKPEVIIIPQSMGQQAVGMLAEQFELDASTEPPAPHLGENTQPNLDDQSIDIPMGGESLKPEVAVSSPIVSSFQTNWSAEPASITVEDEKLFEQPAANWSDLTEMALEVSEENDQPAQQPRFTEPGLVQGDTTPVETGTAEGIEHF
ncbi:MAG: response regulator [Acidobacteria bacterium]|nr:response regulator [Acidobacteriota bacterium]